MSRHRQIRRRGRFSLVLGTFVTALLIAAVAYADNVKNDVVGTPPSATIIAGNSLTVKYWIQETGGSGNATSASPVVVTINVPSGASVDTDPTTAGNQTSLTFTACNTSGKIKEAPTTPRTPSSPPQRRGPTNYGVREPVHRIQHVSCGVHTDGGARHLRLLRPTTLRRLMQVTLTPVGKGVRSRSTEDPRAILTGPRL